MRIFAWNIPRLGDMLSPPSHAEPQPASTSYPPHPSIWTLGYSLLDPAHWMKWKIIPNKVTWYSPMSKFPWPLGLVNSQRCFSLRMRNGEQASSQMKLAGSIAWPVTCVWELCYALFLLNPTVMAALPQPLLENFGKLVSASNQRLVGCTNNCDAGFWHEPNTLVRRCAVIHICLLIPERCWTFKSCEKHGVIDVSYACGRFDWISQFVCVSVLAHWFRLGIVGYWHLTQLAEQ